MIEVLISASARGRWTLKATPGDVESATDSIEQLERMGCVTIATADLVRRILNVLANAR